MNHDSLERRCPRLGGPVSFEYCRTCGEDRQPCFKVFDCWWEHFDVVGYFQSCLSREAFEQLSRKRAPDKVASLVELIRQARARVDASPRSQKDEPSG